MSRQEDAGKKQRKDAVKQEEKVTWEQEVSATKEQEENVTGEQEVDVAREQGETRPGSKRRTGKEESGPTKRLRREQEETAEEPAQRRNNKVSRVRTQKPATSQERRGYPSCSPAGRPLAGAPAAAQCCLLIPGLGPHRAPPIASADPRAGRRSVPPPGEARQPQSPSPGSKSAGSPHPLAPVKPRPRPHSRPRLNAVRKAASPPWRLRADLGSALVPDHGR
ncbi:hypothetical protein NDU88_008749 [Pleurodeles waltl]|uniref:Uncharacterized protein n=1 Tax=Pleurodeles waltl TaxID=8319 RepID=A0AAV7NXF9_PLEWA|nr:hypothetical protein NDU88_008749 [Pleurodeles waltl]